MVHGDEPVGLDGPRVEFDDERAVLDAGVVLVATLATFLLVIDVDNFVGEVCGRLQQVAAYGYTMVLGYHPILATGADTREVLHIRLAQGIGEHEQGDAALLRRADRSRRSYRRERHQAVARGLAFWNTEVFKRLETAGWPYSIGVRMQKATREAVQAIQESAWQTIEDYPKEGEAQIAEIVAGDRRLIVRRTWLIGAHAELWPDWRHF